MRAAFLGILTFLLMPGIWCAPVVEQVGGRHVAGFMQGTQVARGGIWIDGMSGCPVMRMTDTLLMPNPYSANPGLYTAPNEGLTDGYSRYTNRSRHGKWFLAFGTSQLGMVVSEQDLTSYSVLRQKDGTKILAELWEARFDESGNQGTEGLLIYWGSDGQTLRTQDVAIGPASEIIIGRLPKPHVHKGDLSSDNAGLYWPASMAENYDIQDSSGNTIKREIDSLAVMDRKTGAILPQRIFYDLAKTDFNGCSISPDGKWLQGQLDFYRINDIKTSTAVARRGAIRGGHGAYAWYQGRSVWVWQEEGADYLSVFDMENNKTWQIMPHAEYGWTNSIHVCTILNPAFQNLAIVSTYDGHTTFSQQCFAIQIDKPLNTAIHPAYLGNSAAANAAWNAGWTPKASWAKIVRLVNMQGEATSYYGQMFASLNFDGDELQWGSNFHAAKPFDIYSARIGGWFSLLTAGGVSPTPVPSPIPTPIVPQPPLKRPQVQMRMKFKNPILNLKIERN